MVDIKSKIFTKNLGLLSLAVGFLCLGTYLLVNGGCRMRTSKYSSMRDGSEQWVINNCADISALISIGLAFLLCSYFVFRRLKKNKEIAS